MWEEFDKVYQLFGFRADIQTESYSIYIFDQGYFHNAEIIRREACPEEELNKVKQDLSKSGYSVSEKPVNNVKDIENGLYYGFFKVDQAKKQVIDEYNDYSNNQTRRLGGMNYTYIRSNFTIDGKLSINEDILEAIRNLLNKDSKSLIILEAPAGFGKTCTSYEVSNILAKMEGLRIPMLMELSKNRRATIFRYVLLSEINIKFHLPYELVVDQIKKGKIPLIIDGFDELLSRDDTREVNNEEATTMLDTIAELLNDESKANILLTSRKSSIFAGEEFDKWIETKLENCEVNRMQILVPTISDWIGREKRDFFNENKISLNNIQNPVLLSMLRQKPFEEFSMDFHDESDILESYINLMLSRERERQFLLLDVDEQRKIMRGLSTVMVQLDLSSATSDEIMTMMETITENDIDGYLKKYKEYPDQDKVTNITEEKFLMKLVNNAMLDRVKPNSNDIGFINEFIFGIFIGEAITNKNLNIMDTAGNYLNIAITSFASEKKEEKDKLYDYIFHSKIDLTTEQKLMAGFNLKGAVTHDFVDEYISNVIFDESIIMENDKYFYNCIFDSCTFKGCTIASNLFEGCHFINCNFYNIIIHEAGDVLEESIFLSCMVDEEIKKCFEIKQKTEQTDTEKIIDFKREILEQYWMPGSEHAEMRKSYRTLYKGIDPKYRKEVSKAVDQLIDEEILVKLIYCLELNKKKIHRIKEILGREG